MSTTSFSLSAQTKSKKSAVGNEATSLTTGGHSNTTTVTTGSGAASQTAGLGHCWLSPAWWILIRRRCSSLLSDDLLTGFVGPDSHPSVSTGLDFRFASTTFLLLLLNVTCVHSVSY